MEEQFVGQATEVVTEVLPPQSKSSRQAQSTILVAHVEFGLEPGEIGRWYSRHPATGRRAVGVGEWGPENGFSVGDPGSELAVVAAWAWSSGRGQNLVRPLRAESSCGNHVN